MKWKLWFDEIILLLNVMTILIGTYINSFLCQITYTVQKWIAISYKSHNTIPTPSLYIHSRFKLSGDDRHDSECTAKSLIKKGGQWCQLLHWKAFPLAYHQYIYSIIIILVLSLISSLWISLGIVFTVYWWMNCCFLKIELNGETFLEVFAGHCGLEHRIYSSSI